MSKEAKPGHPVHELIAQRWSPYGFSSRPVPREDLLSLFEAVRWSASSFNEQPWRFLVAARDDGNEFERMLSCLMEGNQQWAKNAPVLGLSAARLRFTHNDKPNRVAVHDVGIASAQLTLEATARGLKVHQMAGILPERAQEVYGVPEGYEIVAGFAIGYAEQRTDLPEKLQERDRKERTRKPLAEFVFTGGWEKTSPWIA